MKFSLIGCEEVLCGISSTAGTAPYTVATSAFYKRLWACFSVKLLRNIGSCGFFGVYLGFVKQVYHMTVVVIMI